MGNARTRFARWIAVLVLTPVFAGLTQSAAAQDVDKGLLNVVAFHAVPGGVVRVVPRDDSDDNLLLKQAFETALRSRGYTVTDEPAPLQLIFETRDQVGSWTDPEQRALVDIQLRGGGASGDEARGMVNIFDTQRGGVLNEGRRGTAVVTPSRFRLEVNLDDKSTGTRLWQAWTIAEVGQRDARELGQAMVPVLVNALGQTIRQKPFEIR